MTASPDPAETRELRERALNQVCGGGEEQTVLHERYCVPFADFIEAVVQPALDDKDDEIRELNMGYMAQQGHGRRYYLEAEAARAELDAANRALAAVRELHQPKRVQTGSETHGGPPQYGELCRYDREKWPCPTVLAIDAAASSGPERGTE